MRTSLAALCLLASVGLARAEPAPVDFGGQRYHVDYQAQVQQPDGQAGQGIAEFTLAGETVDNWTKLIGYHYYPEQVADPSLAVVNLGKYLKEQNKDFNYALYENKKKGDATIDFISWEKGSDVLEFDVFKYARAEFGPGLIALQYAQRFKLGDMSVEEFRALRERSVALMDATEVGPMRRYFAEEVKNPTTRERLGAATDLPAARPGADR